jgi:hypothetical protein
MEFGFEFESFEVVIIQRHETFTVEGNQIEAGEHLPYSEQWGIKGWTYSDRPSAERKFNELRDHIKGFGHSSRLSSPSEGIKCIAAQSGSGRNALPKQ